MLALLGKAIEVSEPEIETQKKSRDLPKHVAIIMDGNGRWAIRRGMPRTAGHMRGIHSVRQVVEKARRLGLRYLTLFAFSSENWQRDRSEVSLIMKLLERYLSRELNAMTREGIQLQVVGDKSRLSPTLQNSIKLAEQETLHNAQMFLTLAISYAGQDELVSAARSIASACRTGALLPEEIDRIKFAEHLFAPTMPSIDLLIRTGGEKRISNFMLWQLAYAELIFLNKLWPDFSGQDLQSCCEEFTQRHRRFGKEF